MGKKLVNLQTDSSYLEMKIYHFRKVKIMVLLPQGFSYFCTDKQTVEGSRSGIMIYYAGNDTWVDALGRYV